MDATVKAVRERVGDAQVQEESEEVRLALMSLASALVSRSPASAPLCVADLASICEKGSLDKFPDAKRAAAELAVILSDVVKGEVSIMNLAPFPRRSTRILHSSYLRKTDMLDVMWRDASFSTSHFCYALPLSA